MGAILEEVAAGWHAEIAPRPIDRRVPTRRIAELAAAVAGAAVFYDVVVTWALLRQSLAEEQNPLVASMMRSFGVAPTLVLGGVVRALIVAGLVFLAVRANRRFVRVTATTVLGAAALWWAAVVFVNAAYLGRLATS